MSTLGFDVTPPASVTDPACDICWGPTRLIGIEPHPVAPHTDLRTFQCLVCDHVQASVIHLAS
jgi:hypothetical protein